MDFSIFPELPELLNMTNKFIFLKSIQKNFINDKKVYEYINNNLENLYEFIWEFDIELINYDRCIRNRQVEMGVTLPLYSV